MKRIQTVRRWAIVTAVAAFVAIVAPAAEAQAATAFSYAFAVPPVVRTPGLFTSAITALTSDDATITINVTALDGTTITSTGDPSCALTATGEQCVTQVPAETVVTEPFTGSYSGAVIDLQISATDADGSLTFVGNTVYPAPPADILDPPVPPTPPVPPIVTTLPTTPITTTATERLSGAALLAHRRSRVIELTNTQRTEMGMTDLQTNADLTQSAQNYVNHLAADGAFSHTDGSVLAGRVTATGYHYEFLGENLAMGQSSAHSVVAAWMASPDHRANMLDPRFTQMGVGIAIRSDGQIVWCIDFGWPRS